MRAYLILFCGLSAALIAVLLALNYAVDPYLTHQWANPMLQRLRPAQEKLNAWGKSYALARLRPSTVYIGNSRTAWGMPVRTPLFAASSVFNAALPGATVADDMHIVRHAAYVGRLDTVVWGLDAVTFSMHGGYLELEPGLLAGDAAYPLRRALLTLKRALSTDMTADSIRLLAGTYGTVCRSSLAFNGQADSACISSIVAARGGAATAIPVLMRNFVRGAGPGGDAMAPFDASLAELCRAGTRVRLYIAPTHALMQDLLYWAGRWPDIDNWTAALLKVAERRRAGGCDLRLYDFSGYNSVTTETTPLASGRDAMLYYWEGAHFRDNVGHMILQRMFGGTPTPLPADFGVELDGPMLAARRAALPGEREAYHRLHPKETALARRIAGESR
ncbi:hypothetical protein [Janthinobacterium sp.]|uniref:hypothetical protein n=1 Tax=Janthinobacterium sp. TaxID=1871054 RepID=UPI00293D2C85|nr:hypothetical protein [Janthinobacterium sp.]